MKNLPGKISVEPDGFQVVFERVYAHPVREVWDAITKPEQLAYWFTDIDMDFREGGKILFRFRDEGKSVSEGKIVRIEEPHLFSWTWEKELALWELKEEGANRTRLTFTYSKVTEDYAVRACAGFHSLLDRLEERLDGSNRRYAFGAETGNAEGIYLRVRYAASIYDKHPGALNPQPLIVQKELDAPVERVWSAISDPAELDKWYFKLEGFKPELGNSFSFRGTGSKGDEYVHRSTITAIEANRLLEYSWAYEGYPGYSLVRFELEPVGSKTKLTLTHFGLDTFPKDHPDFAVSSFTGGWTEIITNMLPNYLVAN